MNSATLPLMKASVALPQLGAIEQPFLDAVIAYWGYLSISPNARSMMGRKKAFLLFGRTGGVLFFKLWSSCLSLANAYHLIHQGPVCRLQYC